MSPSVEWILYSGQGTLVRIAAGVGILSVFAILDVRKNGVRNSRRLKEYAFLAVCALLAVAYGAINDWVTVNISWQYFYYGKGLDEVLGPGLPDFGLLRNEAIKIGMKSSWTVGLVAAVAVLMANNPSKKYKEFPFRQLYRYLPLLLIPPLLVSPMMGLMGYFLVLSPIAPDIGALIPRENLLAHRKFICVWGVHLGGYIGGVLGIIWVCVKIRLARKGLVVEQKDENRPTPL